MARPIKNNCDYFPHDRDMRNHKKIKSIRTKFKSQGYAVWVMILEYLTGNDGNEFEYSEMEFELMSGDFDEPAELIKSVVDYAIKLELLFSKNDFIFSESLNERLAPVYEKRGKAKESSKSQQRKNGKYVVDTNNTEQTVVTVTETTEQTELLTSETPQSKVNEIKVKEIKKNKIKTIEEISYPLAVDFWLKEFHLGWTFENTHGAKMKSIIKKIKKVILDTGKDPTSDSIINTFKAMCNKLPQWYKDKDLSIIDSKFNEIITEIKNSNNGISNKQPTGKESIYRPK